MEKKTEDEMAQLRESLRHPDVVMAQRVIENFLNCFDTGRCEEFSKLMSQSHRTLQQNFTRLCINWLDHLANLPDNWYDLRNEGSVKFARSIKKQIDDAYLPMI